MRSGLLFIITLVVLTISNAQDSTNVSNKIYKLNYKSEIPITVGLYVLNFYTLTQLGRKPTLDSYQINSLNKNDVWAFDRNALNQPTSQRFRAQNISDWGLGVSILLPALLFIDSKIQESWLDITLLYLETQAINSNLYTWGGPMFTKRVRPFVYYDEIPMDEKTTTGTTNSFFSGHTSWAASASFFTAKVFSDYYPELGGKKWLLFAAALIPPAFVGYNRYRGLKHFPTDILVGTAVGAAVGILTPHLHKIKNNKRSSISITPYTGQYSGLVLRLSL